MSALSSACVSVYVHPNPGHNWEITMHAELVQTPNQDGNTHNVIQAFVSWYLMLQVTAVFIWLPDLFLQLFAALILIGQLFGQQLIPLPGLVQLLHCGRWFHLHSLGDILAERKHPIRVASSKTMLQDNMHGWYPQNTKHIFHYFSYVISCSIMSVNNSVASKIYDMITLTAQKLHHHSNPYPELLWIIITLTTGSLPRSLSSSSCSSLTRSSRFLSSSPLLHSLCSLWRSSCDNCSARCCSEVSSCCTLLRRFSFS